MRIDKPELVIASPLPARNFPLFACPFLTHPQAVRPNWQIIRQLRVNCQTKGMFIL